MNKEAKGKAERQMQAARRRIPIQVISTDQWRVPVKFKAVAALKCDARARRVLQFQGRETNLSALITSVYEKLAA